MPVGYWWVHQYTNSTEISQNIWDLSSSEIVMMPCYAIFDITQLVFDPLGNICRYYIEIERLHACLELIAVSHSLKYG